MSTECAEEQAGPLPPVAMHDRYGPFLRSFFARYFNPIQFPQAGAERLRELACQGTLVYLSRSASLIHFLYLNHVCLQHELPLARFVNGVDPVLVQPVDQLWHRLQRMGDEDEAGIEEEGEDVTARQLARQLAQGRAALLFLGRPTTLVNPHAAPEVSLLETLLQAQQTQARPIFLVPHLIVWDVHPEREDKSLADAIFGEAQEPGLLRSLYVLLRRYKGARVKLAEPLSLQAFLAEHPGETLQELAASLRAAVQSRVQLELFDVTGPRIRPHAEFKAEILEDHLIRAHLEAAGEGEPGKTAALEKRAHDLLDEIAAEPRIQWPLGLNATLNVFWKRMYEGFVVDEEGFERVRAAIRRGPILFCPSHKSHVDYLVLSQLCLKYRVPLPHIAAGVNLSFWPMGPIFRHSGAFFLRRSFKGDLLYPVVFRTYLRHVMKEGFPIEFFLEGGRSRTGKLLPPRFGILSWLLEAYLEGESPDLTIMPVSIDYEKVVESRSYLHELSGGEKKKEDVAGLLRSSQALRSRYGKIYVQMGQALSVGEYLAERGITARQVDEERKRQLVQSLAHRVLYEINSVATVTPSALVAASLLTHRRRGMTRAELVSRARWLTDWVKRRSARLSATLGDFERALAEAAARFSQDGLVTIQDTGGELVYAPVMRRRLALDYYRNNLLHHFVNAALVVTALESFTVEAVPRAPLEERVRGLSRLFKHEFLFRSEKYFSEEFGKVLAELGEQGVLAEEAGFVVKPPAGAELRRFLKGLLEHFLEAYALAALHLAVLLERPVGERDFTSGALQRGERLFVAGEIGLHESLSREVLSNALSSFQDRGVLERFKVEGQKGHALRLTEAYRSPEALTALTAEITAFQGR
jgi:glycerol-3-phosphate O-acyltransferase